MYLWFSFGPNWQDGCIWSIYCGCLSAISDREHPWLLMRAWKLMHNASVLEKDLLNQIGFLPSCLSSEMESNIVPWSHNYVEMQFLLGSRNSCCLLCYSFSFTFFCWDLRVQIAAMYGNLHMLICTWERKFEDINLSFERDYSSLKYYIKQTANKAFIDIIPWLSPGCIK